MTEIHEDFGVVLQCWQLHLGNIASGRINEATEESGPYVTCCTRQFDCLQDGRHTSVKYPAARHAVELLHHRHFRPRRLQNVAFPDTVELLKTPLVLAHLCLVCQLAHAPCRHPAGIILFPGRLVLLTVPPCFMMPCLSLKDPADMPGPLVAPIPAEDPSHISDTCRTLTLSTKANSVQLLANSAPDVAYEVNGACMQNLLLLLGSPAPNPAFTSGAPAGVLLVMHEEGLCCTNSSSL